MNGNPDQDPPLTEQPCLIGGEGMSRDVVQPRPQRQANVFKAPLLSGSGQNVQRNRLIEGERTRLDPTEIGDVAYGSKGAGDVAGQAADIGALGDMGAEGGVLKALVPLTLPTACGGGPLPSPIGRGRERRSRGRVRVIKSSYFRSRTPSRARSARLRSSP
jgi:hypothetical protein